MIQNTLKNGLCVLMLSLPVCMVGQSKTINITSLGAKGDGVTKNTTFIQKAIDQVSAVGGGQVIIPAGRFVTGVIKLKSNVDLHLEKEAFLLATTQRIDYGKGPASALIVADKAEHIALTGYGVIDGQGEGLLKDLQVLLEAGIIQDNEWKTENPWHQVRSAEINRPMLINFEDCNDVQVRNIELKNGSCWVQRYENCRNMLFDGIKVESNTYWNNDGIDLVDCVNAVITNSFFNADDDGICLKSEKRNHYCENITVENCIVRSSANAVKLGTASHGGFKNISIRNIKVYDTFRSAVAIESVDGGILENIDVNNIKAFNTGNAFVVRLGHRNKDEVISQVRNVSIRNMTVEVPKEKPDKGYPMEGPALRYPHNVFPSSVTGIPGHPVQNVKLENIEIVYPGGGDKNVACIAIDSLVKVPENPAGYPEFSMFGELPAWAFYSRHVEGLQLSNVRVSYKEEDYRPAFVFDDVKQLQLDNVNVMNGKAAPAVVLSNVKGFDARNVQLPFDNATGIVTLK